MEVEGGDGPLLCPWARPDSIATEQPRESECHVLSIDRNADEPLVAGCSVNRGKTSMRAPQSPTAAAATVTKRKNSRTMTHRQSLCIGRPSSSHQSQSRSASACGSSGRPECSRPIGYKHEPIG